MSNIATLEDVIQRITKERDISQQELDRIITKYANGGMYSSDDSTEEDYLEGKIIGLDTALWALNELKRAKSPDSTQPCGLSTNGRESNENL